jgi:ATP-dependent RNA helicase DeaD
MTQQEQTNPIMNQTTSDQAAFQFTDLQLSEPLLRAVKELGYTTPSPIQEKTIPWLMQGRDLIGQAQTGTGKTAAFALPALMRLLPDQQVPQVLVLAPTRELAIQVASQFEVLGAHQKNTRVIVLCGGQDYRPQLKALRDGAQIVVGTPGRILDHIERKTLNLSGLRTFVLDEADEMLRMGFIDDVEKILSELPKEKQIALFSATMPHRIRQIANQYLTDPVSIEIRMDTATVKSVDQRFILASQQQKPDALLRVLATETSQGVIVFTRTKSSTEEVTTLLQQQGHRAMAIHGDITQALRERVIAQFKQGAIDILVATDVAARGLDVERVTHVINYDMAHDCETYVHRIGRTGRAGRSGVAILFVTPRETRMLAMLERHTRQRIEKTPIPSNHLIQAARQERFMASINERLEHKHVGDYRYLIENFIKESELSALDVAATLALLLHKDKPWQQDLPAIKSPPRPTHESRGGRGQESFGSARSGSRDRGAFDRSNSRPSTYRGSNDRGAVTPRVIHDETSQELFRIDVGRVHGVKPGNIVGAIANEAGLQSRYITGLKINEDHSTVRLPSGLSKDVFVGLNKAWVCGRQLKLTSLGAA